jgi:methylated-DNA-[protein]-cysteine S-methyltransferase
MTRTPAHPRLISGTIDTPIGALALIADEAGMLHMAEFADCLDRMERWLGRRLGKDRAKLESGHVPGPVKDAFAAYFGGDVGALRELAVRLTGTTFQNEVWTALRDVRPGETFAYGAFAERLGRPQSARAVGHANGANPLSIVVPCHRLVGADGALTNYGGGIERKRWLLDHEARHASR